MRYLLIAVYAAAPLAALAADNRLLVTTGELIPYYLLVVGPALLATAVVSHRKGAAAGTRLSVCLSVAILVIFDYRELRPVLSKIVRGWTPSMLFLWALLLAAAVFVMARLARRFASLPLAMLAAGAVLLIPPLVDFAAPRSARASNPQPPGLARHLTLKQRPAPNVYFLMLDAYGRADRLKQEFDFDNSGFVRFLRSSGFVVPTRNQSAYLVTGLSVPSMMDMRYVWTRGAIDWDESADVQAGRNAVVSAFRSLGYSYALAPSELNSWDCEGVEDLCIHPTKVPGLHIGGSLASALMDRTPIGDVIRSTTGARHLGPLAAKRQFPLAVAKAVVAKARRPVFTYAHVLLTHLPAVYVGPNCQALPHDEPDTIDTYVGSMRCANADTAAAIRFITARDRDAVIVLASDHGADPGFDLTVPEWTLPEKTLRSRYSNFVALRLPQRCREDVPNDLLAVNIFRVVLGCLADPDPPLLATRQYLTSPDGDEIRPAPWFSR